MTLQARNKSGTLDLLTVQERTRTLAGFLVAGESCQGRPQSRPRSPTKSPTMAHVVSIIPHPESGADATEYVPLIRVSPKACWDFHAS